MKHLKITVKEKRGKCPHKVGDSWKIPYSLIKPKGLCGDAHYVLIPYLSMATGGGKSWEEDGRWLIHCPSKSGIIFEIETTDDDHEWPDNLTEITH